MEGQFFAIPVLNQGGNNNIFDRIPVLVASFFSFFRQTKQLNLYVPHFVHNALQPKVLSSKL